MKGVAIWAGASFRWLWVPLAEKLKNETGCAVGFLCQSEQDAGYFRRVDDNGTVDDYVTTGRFFHLYDEVDQDEPSIIRQARANESRYGVLVTDLLQTDRHLGRGFSALGSGHPRSRFSQKATYLKSLHFFNRVVRFWEEYFDQHQPELILGAPASVVGKACSVVARSREIPIRNLWWSKYKEYFTWAFDEFGGIPYLESIYHSIPDGTVHPEVTVPRAEKEEKFRRVIIQRGSALHLMKYLCVDTLYYGVRKWKGVQRLGNYLLIENWKYQIRTYRRLKELKARRFLRIEDLRGMEFVFYPLHMEPETSLSVQSPEFNEQMALIHLIAKNLPGGVRLVVKEHLYGAGSRPYGFYSTLEEIPNLLVVSPYENAVEVAKASRCVVVITSSLGLEATVLGIPVISFGLHNFYNYVPHVHVVTSWMELRELLRKLCLEDDERVTERYRQDGARLIEAIRRMSFNLEGSEWDSGMGEAGINLFGKGKERATPEEVDLVYSALMGRLEKKNGANVRNLGRQKRGGAVSPRRGH